MEWDNVHRISDILNVLEKFDFITYGENTSIYLGLIRVEIEGK